ncbi:histidine phosphatase family protein [Aliidiomarina minuta]|nr:histidine phosphatase family protein [Aliidiomarina minuta]
MASLYLIRHGQASFGADNYDDLSQLGKSQSRHLGQVFHQQGIMPTRILAGSLQRQQQTARGIVEGLQGDLTINMEPAWNEFDHENVLQVFEKTSGQGSLRQQLAVADDKEACFQKLFVAAIRRWVEGQHDSSYTESWGDFQQRISAVFKQLAEQVSAHERILVVTSGGPISMVVQQLLKLDTETALRLNWRLVNAGITKVSLGQGGPQLVSLNEHMHFSGEQRSLLTSR